MIVVASFKDGPNDAYILVFTLLCSLLHNDSQVAHLTNRYSGDDNLGL